MREERCGVEERLANFLAAAVAVEDHCEFDLPSLSPLFSVRTHRERMGGWLTGILSGH